MNPDPPHGGLYEIECKSKAFYWLRAFGPIFVERRLGQTDPPHGGYKINVMVYALFLMKNEELIEDIFFRINWYSVDSDFIMHVGTCTPACIPH